MKRFAGAVLLQEGNEITFKAMYIEAENDYEAIGKAHSVANRLWPKASVHVSVVEADERHLITDPDKAGLEPPKCI